MEIVLTQEQERKLIACARMGADEGSPIDQQRAFLNRTYFPLPWQWGFHAAAREADIRCETHTVDPNTPFSGDCACGPVEVCAGGARGPGKSHAVFGQVALDDCQRVPGLKVLFLRKTGKSAQESFQDLIDKVISGNVAFRRNKNVIIFPNKSRILLGGFNNEDDIDKYVGVEYDVIVIEELNQLTLEKLEKLKGSLRTSKKGWRPRIYGSFNPGGVGHAMVKKRYVLPYRMHNETTTRFVPATYKQNPHLNIEYLQYLEGLDGDLGKAWREGDFDLFAGQYFGEWRYDVHVCEPFAIPPDWRRFMAGDYGHTNPASIGWYAIDPKGTLYRYRELYGSGYGYSSLATAAVEIMNPNEKIEYQVWDPAIWSKKGERDDDLTGAQVYSAKWKELTGKEPRLIRGDNSRVVGWGVVREYLKPVPGPMEGTVTARLQVFSTCPKLIETLPELQHSDRNPEDVDTDGEDHAADELRYAVMSEPRPAITAEQKDDLIFKKRMAEKRARMGIREPRYRRRGVG